MGSSSIGEEREGVGMRISVTGGLRWCTRGSNGFQHCRRRLEGRSRRKVPGKISCVLGKISCVLGAVEKDADGHSVKEEDSNDMVDYQHSAMQ